MANDPLTNLPLPSDTGLNLGDVMKLDGTQVCKSTMQADFYTPSGDGKVEAAVVWYAAHLNGFKHTHLYSVLYAKVQPGFVEKTIMSLNAQKVICP